MNNNKERYPSRCRYQGGYQDRLGERRRHLCVLLRCYRAEVFEDDI